MKTDPLPILPARQVVSAAWQLALHTQLQPNETAIASVELDLDANLHFASGILVVTNLRLLVKASSDGDWTEWLHRQDLTLAHYDHAGVGTLELHSRTARLACWRYTLGHNPEALRLIGHFEQQREAAVSGHPVYEPEQEICPSCKAPLPPDQEECPICTREIPTPPSTWTLFRLWRFARPYRGQLLAGFLLTLASTAATLVPPYLAMPLMDNVLIPYQNGQKIDAGLVGLYLSGLFGAALVTLLPLPFIAWMIHVVRDKLRHGFEKIDRVWGEVTNVLADTIPGIRVVKAFAQEKREAARFREANAHNLLINDRVNKVWSLFSPTVTFLTEIGLLIVWAVGIWQVSKGLITVGVLTAFLAYIGRFYTRLDSMSRIVSVTQKAAAGAKRIFDILDHVSSVPEAHNPVHLQRIEGRIDIKEIGFRYGNRAVLRGVDLSIKPGEMIGLVGHSGSGKSTLVNLICRFYDVSEGAILVDGVDIRSLPVAEYRRHIGLVLQEPFLFFGTIADNIAYGKPGATREEILAAARAANAHEFILRLPHGYDSMVGERGQTLSGGERQRISIARALLIDPQLLILDEATSSVDTTTEKEIQKALDNLVRGRTTIAIAHRLSTLRQADRLVVLDKGQIVEVGKHEELLAREGAYYRLYQAQQRQAENDALADSQEDIA
jgi:ABC-type multidrug transport system fused ATPase/permease subunit